MDWCAELAAVGVADSLDHSDLHDGQFFAPEPGRFTCFDWGDALVGHPFCSLLVPARAARERYGSEVLPRLRDACLEPWTDAGRRTPSDLRRREPGVPPRRDRPGLRVGAALPGGVRRRGRGGHDRGRVLAAPTLLRTNALAAGGRATPPGVTREWGTGSGRWPRAPGRKPGAPAASLSYTRHELARRTHHRRARTVTSEGRPAVRYRTAVVVPPARYEVILVSPGARRRLRGRYRMSATNV